MTESNYHFDKDVLQERKSDHKIHPIFLSRTSPREMTGEVIADSELMALFEASRWAPSHFNVQPWRFIYAKSKTSHWQKFMDLLWTPNKDWCKNGSVLVAVISKKYQLYKGKKELNPTHSYDSGAAWMAMALEGTARGLVVHGLGGFDYDKAYEVFGVNKDTHNVNAMLVIGKRPDKQNRKMKETITSRNPVKSFVFEGVFVDKDDKL